MNQIQHTVTTRLIHTHTHTHTHTYKRILNLNLKQSSLQDDNPNSSCAISFDVHLYDTHYRLLGLFSLCFSLSIYTSFSLLLSLSRHKYLLLCILLYHPFCLLFVILHFVKYWNLEQSLYSGFNFIWLLILLDFNYYLFHF